jgi:hypothetical protein
MKKTELIMAWVCAVIFIVGGVCSVITHQFAQGHGAYRVAPLRGPLAVIFGSVTIAFGAYLIFLLMKGRFHRTGESPNAKQNKDGKHR